MKKQKLGFTLAELLLALIVMSLLIIAVAPVLTKRVVDNIKVSNSSQGEFKLYTYQNSADNPECTLAADGSKAYDCTFTAPTDAKSVSVVMVSGGGGGAGATEGTITPKTDFTTSSTGKELEITNGMKNVVVTQTA